MCARFAAMGLILAGCGVLQAQGVFVAASLGWGESHWFLLDIDHGPTPTATTITVELTGQNASLLLGTLMDLDQHATQQAPSFAREWATGTGTALLFLDLPARAGVHQLMLMVETDDSFVDFTDYTLFVTTTVGAVTVRDSKSVSSRRQGTRNVFDRIIEQDNLTERAGTYRIEFELDFGQNPQDTTFYVEVYASYVGTARLLELSSPTPIELAYWTDPSRLLTVSEAFTTAAHTGVVRFRLEYDLIGSLCSFRAKVFTHGNVELVAVNGLVGPEFGTGDWDGIYWSDSYYDDSLICSAGGTGIGIPLLVPLLALLGLRRRGCMRTGARLQPTVPAGQCRRTILGNGLTSWRHHEGKQCDGARASKADST